MATYTIKAPDGNQYSVQGPDNASQEDVQAEVLRQHPDAAGSPQTGAQGTSAAGVQGTVLSNGKVSQATPADQLDPTSGMSTTDKVVAGMGKAFSDAGTGAKQLVQKTAAFLGSKSAQAAEGLTEAQVAAQRETDKALMSTNSGKAGEMLGQMVMALSLPGGGAAQMARAGAMTGALTPTAAGESSTQNAVVGAMLGVAGQQAGKLMGKVVGGLTQPLGKSALTELQQDGIKVLTANGVPLDAAQQSGTKFAQTLKNVVGDSPFTGSTFGNEQKQAFTRAVMTRLGATGAEDASPVEMQRVRVGLGKQFDSMAQKYPMPIDNTLLTKLATISTAAESELDAGQMGIIGRQIDNLIDHAAPTGTMTGAAFQNARSSLSRLQSQQNVTGHWAGEIHDALTDALQRNATPQDAQAITQMRTQWKALRQVQDAIGTDNQISPAALYGVLDRAKNRNMMVYGQGDQSLVQLAQSGVNVLGQKTANSGTTQRALGMLAMGSGLAAVDGLVHGDPKEALSMGLLGVAGPNMAKLIVENPTSARIIGQWARSKVIANFRTSIKEQGARMMGGAGASAVPVMGGSQNIVGQMGSGTPYEGVNTNPGEETQE